MKALNGRVINYICTLHAIEYGVDKAKVPADRFIDSYCDICEAKGIQDAPQKVTEVANVNDIRNEDLDDAKPIEGGLYEFKPSAEKEKALKIKSIKNGHHKKTS